MQSVPQPGNRQADLLLGQMPSEGQKRLQGTSDTGEGKIRKFHLSSPLSLLRNFNRVQVFGNGRVRLSTLSAQTSSRKCSPPRLPSLKLSPTSGPHWKEPPLFPESALDRADRWKKHVQGIERRGERYEGEGPKKKIPDWII